MMRNVIFKQLIDKGVVNIYMDDIFGSKTKEQYHEIVV